MNIFEDSINLLKGSAFTEITVNDTFIFLESPAIFSEYIVPLTWLDKFDTQTAHELFLKESEEEKNISYYIRHTLQSEYSGYLKSLKLSHDYTDSYMVNELKTLTKFDDKGTTLLEVTENTFEEYKAIALDIFNTWVNEEDYVNHFHNLAINQQSETKNFKDFCLTLNDTIVSIASVVWDTEMNLAYIHNAGTLIDFRKNGYFTIINGYLANYLFNLGITRIYAIVEKDSDSQNIYRRLNFKEQDTYYSYS